MCRLSHAFHVLWFYSCADKRLWWNHVVEFSRQNAIQRLKREW